MILAYVKRNAGKVDYGELARELYGEDSRVVRQRLYFAFDALKKQGHLVQDAATGVYTLSNESAG